MQGSPPPGAAWIGYETTDETFTVVLNCEHGQWGVRFPETPDQMRARQASADDVRTTVIELITNLMMVHDQHGLPVECVRHLRPPSMAEPAEPPKTTMYEMNEKPLFLLHDPMQTIVIDKVPEAPYYRIRMMCEHGVNDMLIPVDHVPPQDENLAGSRFLWDHLQDAITAHHGECKCECLAVPAFEVFHEMAEVGIVGVGVLPMITGSAPPVN